MLRRTLISALCISLASLAPVPLSACAMLMKLPAECGPGTPAAPGKTVERAHCEQMANEAAESASEEVTLTNGASGRACCNITSAPIPEAGASRVQAETTSAPVVMKDPAATVPLVASAGFEAKDDLARSVLLSDKQALFCSFLI